MSFTRARWSRRKQKISCGSVVRLTKWSTKSTSFDATFAPTGIIISISGSRLPPLDLTLLYQFVLVWRIHRGTNSATVSQTDPERIGCGDGGGVGKGYLHGVWSLMRFGDFDDSVDMALTRANQPRRTTIRMMLQGLDWNREGPRKKKLWEKEAKLMM